MTINTQHNGYAIDSKLTAIKEKFENAAKQLFGDEVKEINHFYYGDTCTFEQYDKFALLTLNDELYKGKLLEL